MVSLCLLFCLILNGLYSTIGFPNPIATFKGVVPKHLQNLLAKGQYEEFARLLQMDDAKRVKPAKLGPERDYMPGEDGEYDDMMWTSRQKNQSGQGDFYKTVVTKWNKVVPYVLDKRYVRGERVLIERAIEKWNLDLGLHILFLPHTIEEDYVMFVKGNGCASSIGKLGGPQAVSLSTICLIEEGTILHEMAHAIGIIHEQERPDRDTYIKIIKKNIPPVWLPQYLKVNYTGITDLGPYDYYSLMHYPIPAPETHRPAFKVLQQGIDLDEIGQRNDQSEIDKDKIKRLYGIL